MASDISIVQKIRSSLQCDKFYKGFIFYIRWLLIFFYLKLQKWRSKKRLNVYDTRMECDNFETCGITATPAEWEFELPQTSTSNQQNSDEILFFGSNSTGISLYVKACRWPTSKKLTMDLCLKMADGRHFVFVDPNGLTVEDQGKFKGAGLRMECLLAMRKWRISYNGLIRNVDPNLSPDDALTHVKFSFIWSTTTFPFDLQREFRTALLAKTIAETEEFSMFNIGKVPSFAQDRYDQGGQMTGTLALEGEEEMEVYLWGFRARAYGNPNIVCKQTSLENYSFIEDGFHYLVGLRSHDKNLSSKYGYILRPSGIHAGTRRIKLGVAEKKKEKSTNLIIHADDGLNNFGGTLKTSLIDGTRGKNKGILPAFLGFTEGNINGKKSRGILLGQKGLANACHSEEELQTDSRPNRVRKLNSVTEIPLVTAFSNDICKQVKIAGGKGSSLAKLVSIANQINNFTVPNGVVVTTASFEEILKNKDVAVAANNLKNDVKVNKNIQESCQRLIEILQNCQMPSSVSSCISSSLEKEFGNDYQSRRYAVRSSSCGEDSEQMSAAGQMETFLGIKGISEINHSVLKCWASQFAATAVEYKRRHGQPLVESMAVVIQEMVSAEKAGVMFTCDPLTGNPKYITITGNYGLGESVVSASAEPDTVIVKRSFVNSDKLEIHNTVEPA